MTFRLSEKVGSKWREFGRELGMYEDVLTSWEIEKRGDTKACWEKVMSHWLQAGGEYPITWDGVCTLLENLNCSEVAKELKKALRATNS